MTKIKLVLIFCIYSFSLMGQFTLQEFELEGRDSVFKCKVVERYDDFVRYLNNITDQNLDSEIQRHSYIALFRLLASDELGQKGRENFSIFDISLEDKNKPYQRKEFLRILENLTKLNYAYQKEFVTHGCTYAGNKIQPKSTVFTESSIKYFAPNYEFGFDFLEKSIKSDTIKSKLRKTGRINFVEYVFQKKLKGKLTKTILQDEFERYEEEYLKIVRDDVFESFDQRDTTKQRRKDSLTIEKRSLESLFSVYELKFNSISEKKVDQITDVIDNLNESAKECNCRQKQPKNSDSDDFPDIVDCEPKDSTVYPGAKIDCTDNTKDDNCDGIEDLCCVDKDGDGFYSSVGCDCDNNIKSLDIFSKCDCNDLDSLVYPGADLVCDNLWNDDNCDGIIDTLQMQRGLEINLNLLDYAYAPYGLTKFGKDKKFISYSGLLGVGIASTIYHRNRSLHFYNLHENAVTLRTQDEFYAKANNLHKRYLVSAYSTLGVYIASMVDLKIQYVRYNSVRDQLGQRRKNCYSYRLILDPLDVNDLGYIGPSLKLKF